MKRISRKLGTLFWSGKFFLAAMLKRLRREKRPRQNVLFIRWDHIGDAVIWMPYAAALTDYFHGKGHKVTLLCAAGLTDLYRESADFDDFIPFDVNAFLADKTVRRRLLADLKCRRFAVVCNPRMAREFLVDDIIAMAAAAPATYGFNCRARLINPRIQRWTRRFYSKLQEVSSKIVHEVEFARSFNRMITGDDQPSAEPGRRLSALPGPAMTGEYYVVLPGAQNPFRCWPAGNYIEAIRYISAKQPGLTAVLAGSPGERPLGESIASALPDVKLTDLTGRTGITEMVGLIAGARFVVGNDSGGIHVAAATGVKSFCMGGYGQWGYFIPYPEPYPVPGTVPPVMITAPECIYHNCDWQCRFFTPDSKRCPCVDGIPLQELLEELEKSVF